MILKPRKYFTILLSVTLALFTLVLPSCVRSGQIEQIPARGELMYEVDYSENLRQLKSIGAFLPHTAIGVFDSSNFKISTSAPLSFAKVSLVHGSGGDFVSMSFNDLKILTDFSSLTENKLPSDSSIVVRTYEEKKEICGFMSRQTSISVYDGNGAEFVIDVFMAIADKSDCKEGESKILSGSGTGLVTALSIRFEENNIIFLLKSVRPLEAVNPEEFSRPLGFIETSAKDFVALLELM